MSLISIQIYSDITILLIIINCNKIRPHGNRTPQRMNFRERNSSLTRHLSLYLIWVQILIFLIYYVKHITKIKSYRYLNRETSKKYGKFTLFHNKLNTTITDIFML